MAVRLATIFRTAARVYASDVVNHHRAHSRRRGRGRFDTGVVMDARLGVKPFGSYWRFDARAREGVVEWIDLDPPTSSS